MHTYISECFVEGTEVTLVRFIVIFYVALLVTDVCRFALVYFLLFAFVVDFSSHPTCRDFHLLCLLMRFLLMTNGSSDININRLCLSFMYVTREREQNKHSSLAVT